MAEEDEIDILGDFSFNSCLAQNNQGIPSCSNREDTVHPQWLLDSVSTNWYDNQTKDNARITEGPSRRLTGNRPVQNNGEIHSKWSLQEKNLLLQEMSKYGRNVRKISQTLKSKTEAEIQALIEAEYGVHLETPSFGLEKNEEEYDIPGVVQEEIVTDDIPVLNKVKISIPGITLPKKQYKKKAKIKSQSLLRPDALENKPHVNIDPNEIFYEDDMIIGSTESVGSDMDSADVLSKKLAKQHKEKVMKKIGNHRRKVSRNYDRGERNKSKDLLKSPTGRQRKDSSLSEDNAKSPKMQIVLGSGQALPLSEGEQVIKIEKKKDSDPESDIDVDVDSDEDCSKKRIEQKVVREEPIAVPLRKLQPMPKRQKKINLNGDGGYTIMHTAAGDLLEVSSEPRRVKKTPVQLIHCRYYGPDKPAPFEVRLNVSALISMDLHAHTSRAEVMGLVGGLCEETSPGGGHSDTGGGHSGIGGGHSDTGGGFSDTGGVRRLLMRVYRPVKAAASRTHCDMDPVSQASAVSWVRSNSLLVLGWHHSHPTFPPAPSHTDLVSQRDLQRTERDHPLLALITSQQWTHSRHSMYRCIRVEDSPEDGSPLGYQLRVKLLPDITLQTLPDFIQQVRDILRNDSDRNEFTVDLEKDVCPQAGVTYLEKCISSTAHHLKSAGYSADDPVPPRLLQAIRDVFRTGVFRLASTGDRAILGSETD